MTYNHKNRNTEKAVNMINISPHRRVHIAGSTQSWLVL